MSSTSISACDPAVSTLAANYFDGHTAASRTVTVNLSIRGSLSFEDGNSRHRYTLDEVVISARLADQPAIVDLPDGGRLEVVDADAFFDAVSVPDAPRRDWEHRIEAYWSRVVVAIVLTGVLAWIVIDQGIPLVAHAAAELAPAELDQAIGNRGLEILDAQVFGPSALTAERRERLRQVFADVVDAVGDRQPYRLEFRVGNRLGPNAVALPSGIVIVTDELVVLADDDDELAAVMAHEVGHARHRHALRALVQNSLVAGLLFLALGDPSGATAIAAGIPTLVVERSYSREFEREADDVAFDYLAARGIPDRRLTGLLERLNAAAGGPDAPGWLASHPRAEERIRR